MKRIQTGFAAITAVLAMSFTIAEHNGAFKPKSVKATTDCFKAGGTNGLKVKYFCPLGVVTISVTDPCSVVAPGDKVWSLDLDNVIASNDVNTLCPGSSTFCCFKVIADDAPCKSPNPVQPTFNIGGGIKPYKVSVVYCKSS